MGFGQGSEGLVGGEVARGDETSILVVVIALDGQFEEKGGDGYCGEIFEGAR